jgi:hypothetical protein
VILEALYLQKQTNFSVFSNKPKLFQRKGRVCRSAYSVRLGLQALVISEFLIANYIRSKTVLTAAE